MKIFAILLAFYAGQAIAEVPKLPSDAIVIGVEECQHVPTRQDGTCITLWQPNGDYWVVFFQNEAPQIITYIEQGINAFDVWTTDKYGSF